MKQLAIAIAALAVMLGAACSTSNRGAPPAPSGATNLERGRTVWVERCARCHGVSGGGAIGPQLSGGKVLEEYPNAADEVELVRNGRGAMPAYKSVLSESDIEAVVAYTREVLATR